MRRNIRRLTAVLVVFCAFIGVYSGISFSAPPEPKDIDAKRRQTIADFLKTRGFENIIPLGGKEYQTQSGFLVKVDGTDKAKKPYAIEILFTKDFKQGAILMVREKTKEEIEAGQKKNP